MNISGVLVMARPGHRSAVEDALAALPGVDVHAATEDDRLIITIEEPDGQVGKTILDIETLPGVLSAALVYQQSVPDSQLEDPYDAHHTP